MMRCRCLLLIAIFTLSTTLLVVAWNLAPPISGVSKPTNFFPHNLQQLKVFADYLTRYRDEHYIYTLFLFSLAYLYKQTFAIPGSFLMNILAGALFGGYLGSALVIPLTGLGATLCFLLSKFTARPLVYRFCGIRLRKLRNLVEENSHRLFFFLLFLRLFPITPHWACNICSPFVGIPLHKFALSVLIGLIPYNVLCVRAGGVLGELQSPRDVLPWSSMAELAALALVVLLAGFLSKKSSRVTATLPKSAF